MKKLLPLLSIALFLMAVISVMVGRYVIAPGDLLGILMGKTEEALESARIVFWDARVPRVIAAILIGGALSVSGASYQGIFKNPMVSPDILGASAGAGFGAALALLLELNLVYVQLFSFGFGVLAVACSYFVSRAIERNNGFSILLMVLTGMVVSALFSAFISIIKYVADPYDALPAITFWLMGGLSYVTASDAVTLFAAVLIGGIPLFLTRWHINVLSLGDEEAKSLGINTVLLRTLVILCATVLTSSAVAVGGMIGWIGLIVPHLARMLAGPDYKKLLPASFLLGALFLLFVDDLARCISAKDLPLGILTAVIGAPFFLSLLYRKRGGIL